MVNTTVRNYMARLDALRHRKTQTKTQRHKISRLYFAQIHRNRRDIQWFHSKHSTVLFVEFYLTYFNMDGGAFAI